MRGVRGEKIKSYVKFNYERKKSNYFLLMFVTGNKPSKVLKTLYSLTAHQSWYPELKRMKHG